VRLTAITFSGYDAGQTDFTPVFAASPQVEREQLLGVIERIADTIIQNDSNQFNSLIVVGHADRQDRADMNCDQRRKSESEAAELRAVSAFDFVKAAVTARLAQSGIVAGEWWDTAVDFRWGLVFAGAGMLLHDPPTAEQRLLNRRVVMLVSMKGP
jgi:flagellar motor protein MotB